MHCRRDRLKRVANSPFAVYQMPDEEVDEAVMLAHLAAHGDMGPLPRRRLTERVCAEACRADFCNAFLCPPELFGDRAVRKLADKTMQVIYYMRDQEALASPNYVRLLRTMSTDPEYGVALRRLLLRTTCRDFGAEPDWRWVCNELSDFRGQLPLLFALGEREDSAHDAVVGCVFAKYGERYNEVARFMREHPAHVGPRVATAVEGLSDCACLL